MFLICTIKVLEVPNLQF